MDSERNIRNKIGQATIHSGVIGSMSNGNASTVNQALENERSETETGNSNPATNSTHNDQHSANVPVSIEQSTSSDGTTVAHSQAETQQSNPYQYRDLVAQEEMADAGFWMMVAAFLTFAVTAIGTFFLAWQVRLTRKAVEDTSEATDAMVEANEIARESSERQARAYLSWKNIELEQHRNIDGVTIESKLAINWHNTGQTPATDFIGDANWQIFDDAMPEDFDYPNSAKFKDEGWLIVGPGNKVGTTCDRRLSTEQFLEIADGKKRAYVWGWAEYTDAFKVRRKTEVAFEIEIIALQDGQHHVAFEATGRHNGIDEGCLRPPKQPE